MEALGKLKTDKEITILKADNGNCTVLMNWSDYEKKLLEMLTDEKTYKRLNKDPTPALQKMNKVLLDLMQSKCLPQQIHKRFWCKNGIKPRFYGLPKIHKDNCPLRYFSYLRTG